MPERYNPNRNAPATRLPTPQVPQEKDQWTQTVDTFTHRVERGDWPTKEAPQRRGLSDDVDPYPGERFGTRVWRWVSGLWR